MSVIECIGSCVNVFKGANVGIKISDSIFKEEGRGMSSVFDTNECSSSYTSKFVRIAAEYNIWSGELVFVSSGGRKEESCKEILL